MYMRKTKAMTEKIIETLRQFNEEFQEDVIADFYIEEIASRIDSLYPTLNRDKVTGIFNELKSGIINLEMIEELERGAWIVIKPTWERCLKQLTKPNSHNATDISLPTSNTYKAESTEKQHLSQTGYRDKVMAPEKYVESIIGFIPGENYSMNILDVYKQMRNYADALCSLSLPTLSEGEIKRMTKNAFTEICEEPPETIDAKKFAELCYRAGIEAALKELTKKE